MSKDRLAAFMDAVIAIIMTILVLELPKPDPVSLQGVRALRDSYVTYILSFFWLGTLWVGLHNEWEHIKVINRKVVWLGIVLLFTTSWIPYSMSVVAIDPMNRLGQALYGMSVLIVTVVNMLLSFSLYRCHYDIEEHDSERHAWMMKMRYIPNIIIKIIGIYLSVFVYPPSMVYTVLVTMLWTAIPFERYYHPDKE